MARPVNADAQETRSRIQKEAARLFADHGVAGTRVRDIASAADVSVAMISHCFGGKDALYQCCVQEVYSDLSTLEKGLFSTVADDTTPDSILEDAVRMSFRLARSQRHTVRLIMREVLDRDGQDPQRVQEVLLPFLEKTSALLGGKTEVDPARLRLPLQSVIFLIVRFALSPDEELRLVGANGKDPIADTEDHLVEMARRLLLSIAPLSVQEQRR